MTKVCNIQETKQFNSLHFGNIYSSKISEGLIQMCKKVNEHSVCQEKKRVYNVINDG